MPFATSIQTYAGTNTPQSTVSMMTLPNWGTGEIWIINSVKFSKSGIVSGAEISHALLATYSDPPNHVGIGSENFGLAPNGDLHVTSGTGFSIINQTTLAFGSTWGAYGGIFPPNLPTSSALNTLFGSIAVNTEGADTFTFGAGIGGIFGAFNEGYLARLPNFAGYNTSWATPSHAALCCRGASGSGLIYFAEAPSTGAQTTIHKLLCIHGGTWVPADWPAVNANITASTLATIMPTDIDAGWTEVTPGGLCVDNMDGNLLVFLAGQSGATNANYLTKINATTGAVMWKTVVPGATIPGNAMAQSNVNGNFVLFVQSPQQIMTFDTSGGSVTTQSSGLAGIIGQGSQCFDTSTGVCVLLCDWTLTAGGPTPLNGSASPFTGYAALYVAPVPVTHGRRYLNEHRPVRVIP